MIISPEAITYLLTGKQRLDHKSIIKFAKIRGIDVSDSMRKNFRNFLLCRNKPSETTLKNIKLLLKEIINNKQYSYEIDNVNLLDEIDLSTPELKLKYMKTIYSDFFRYANLEDSFLCNEVNDTFKGLNILITLKDNESLDDNAWEEFSRCKLLPKIDYSDNLYLAIDNQVNSFNMDLLLYYFACIAVDNEERDASVIQQMFDCLLSEIANSSNGKLKSHFSCYVEIIKSHYRKENKNITNQEIAKTYDMDIRDFYFYKSGERALPLKTIAFIIEQGHSLYFMTLFWIKLITPFLKDVDARLEIIKKINLYPKFFDIAKAKFCDFERQNIKTGHE